MGVAAGLETTSDDQQSVMLVCGMTSARMSPEYAKVLATQLIMLADIAERANANCTQGESS